MINVKKDTLSFFIQIEEDAFDIKMLKILLSIQVIYC